MSKGLGENYVRMMRRYHLPHDTNPRSRISKICDRAFYHDGAFKYKLPRFYRDRLYRKKFPYDTKVWSVKNQCYVQKIVYRYASKNMLALQMQTEVRSRILAQYNEKFAELRQAYPDKSDTEIGIILSRLEVSSRVSRQQDIYSKMSRFYRAQRFAYRRF